MKVSITLSFNEVVQIKSFVPEKYRREFERFMDRLDDRLKDNKFVKTIVNAQGFTFIYEDNIANMINEVEYEMDMDLKMFINGFLGFINTIKESRNIYMQRQRRKYVKQYVC